VGRIGSNRARETAQVGQDSKGKTRKAFISKGFCLSKLEQMFDKKRLKNFTNGLDKQLNSCIVIHKGRHKAFREAKETKQMETKYISATDTAKLVRAELKATFSGVKFAVQKRHFSLWVTIPANAELTTDQVREITDRFEGAEFDGSQDLKSYKKVIVNGERIQYEIDFIFVEREWVA